MDETVNFVMLLRIEFLPFVTIEKCSLSFHNAQIKVLSILLQYFRGPSLVKCYLTLQQFVLMQSIVIN